MPVLTQKATGKGKWKGKDGSISVQKGCMDVNKYFTLVREPQSWDLFFRSVIQKYCQLFYKLGKSFLSRFSLLKMLSWIKDIFHSLMCFTAKARCQVQYCKHILCALQVVFMMIVRLYFFLQIQNVMFYLLKMFNTTDIFSKHLISNVIT